MKPELENINIPLKDRYIQFIEWVTQQNFLNTDYLANILDVRTGVVDLFFQLEGFEDDEFQIVEQHEIDIDMLYIIVHYKSIVRQRIYPRINEFKGMAQPVTAIREFVEEEVMGEYESELQKISAQYWTEVNGYLKGRDIKQGVLSANFRSLIYRIAKSKDRGDEITKRQLDWLSEGIMYDAEYELGVFLNDNVKANYTSDCAIIENVLELIKGLVE